MKLNTIQTKEKLNDVYSVDDIGPGGAYHDYEIRSVNGDFLLGEVHFQKGARKLDDSRHGVLDSDLLEIVRDRLKHFQSGQFACEENERALRCVEEALYQMNLRVENRISRGVLGTMNK